MRYLSRISRCSKALCLSFLLLTASSVQSFALANPLAPWTSVGSVGTVDEADAGKIGFSFPQAYLNGGFTTALIRYNVTATEGLFVGPNKKLTARFFKPDVDTRLIINLFQQDLNTGALVLLTTLDTNAYAAVGFQVQSVPIGGGGFDFARHSYFIEARLIRNAAGGGGGDPRLSMLQISTS